MNAKQTKFIRLQFDKDKTDEAIKIARKLMAGTYIPPQDRLPLLDLIRKLEEAPNEWEF